jgi:hypothetical protein
LGRIGGVAGARGRVVGAGLAAGEREGERGWAEMRRRGAEDSDMS